MIWILGLITGLAFDMPLWWWVLGFVLAMFSAARVVIR
jgi:hypothetical protein